MPGNSLCSQGLIFPLVRYLVSCWTTLGWGAAGHLAIEGRASCPSVSQIYRPRGCGKQLVLLVRSKIAQHTHMHTQTEYVPTLIQHGLDEATKQYARLVWDWLSCYIELTVDSQTTSPTSQLHCFLIVSKLGHYISYSGHHFWTFGTLKGNTLIKQIPSFYFHPLHFILSHQLLLVQL